MDITLPALIVFVTACASFFAGTLASKRRFRSEILKLAVEASAYDIKAMEEMEEEFKIPVSVCLSFYLSYFTKIQSGKSVTAATKAGVDAMKETVGILKVADILYYEKSKALESFTIDRSKLISGLSVSPAEHDEVMQNLVKIILDADREPKERRAMLTKLIKHQSANENEEAKSAATAE